MENSIPVYCRDCRSRYSYKRCPEKDVETESGKVFEYAFKCQNCGHVTYRHTVEMNLVAS